MSDNLSRFTKNCRKCRFIMAETSKKCPACETTQGPHFLTGIVGLLLILALFGGIYGIAFGAVSGLRSDDKRGATIAGEGANEPNSEITADVGNTIRTEQFEITITSIEEKKEIGTKYIHSEADKGNTYVAVAWQYKSIGDTSLESIPYPMIILANGNKTEITSDISASGSYASELDIHRVRFRELIPEVLVKDAHVFIVSKKMYAKGGWRLRIKSDRDASININ